MLKKCQKKHEKMHYVRVSRRDGVPPKAASKSANSTDDLFDCVAAPSEVDSTASSIAPSERRRPTDEARRGDDLFYAKISPKSHFFHQKCYAYFMGTGRDVLESGAGGDMSSSDDDTSDSVWLNDRTGAVFAAATRCA